MYVCLCNGTRDRELREAANNGIRCARKAYASLGTRPRCGRCLDLAQEILDEAHEIANDADATCAA